MTDYRAVDMKPDVEALRDEIRHTRAELGDTVQALAAKADVKARIKESATEVKAEIRRWVKEAVERRRARAGESAAHATARIKGSAGHAMGRARRWVGPARPEPRTGTVLLEHDAAGRWEFAEPPRAGGRLTGIGESARQRPVPWLAAGGGVALVITFLVIRRRRR